MKEDCKDCSYVQIVLLVAILVILGIVMAKLNKKEGYCVDISGGFKPPCDCGGNCVMKK